MKKRKGNSNYRAGYRVENNLVNYLKRKNGYDVAARSAGSHSPIDVWGLRTAGAVIFIAQCKKHEGLIEKKNTEILRTMTRISPKIIAFDVWPDRKDVDGWHFERIQI